LPAPRKPPGKSGSVIVADKWPNKDVPVMSARIAPEPISNGYTASADYRPRMVRGDSGASVNQQAQWGDNTPAQPQQKPAQPQITMPPPAPPPGAAFAVALITGQLPPRPTSERELQMRLGSADLPAQGSLALHDRRV